MSATSSCGASTRNCTSNPCTSGGSSRWPLLGRAAAGFAAVVGAAARPPVSPTPSPVISRKMPSRMKKSPLPPLSTLPACASTGSRFGVLATARSAATTAWPSTAARSAFPACSFPPAPAAASAAAAASRTTVKIVPSTGRLTPLYAMRLPSANAAANASPVRTRSSARLFAIPRRICERITPEFPRAPISAPCAAAFATSPTLWVRSSVTSRQADFIVSSIFVPVSPSGTGNTLSAFTISWWRSSQVWPAHSSSRNRGPSTGSDRGDPGSALASGRAAWGSPAMSSGLFFTANELFLRIRTRARVVSRRWACGDPARVRLPRRRARQGPVPTRTVRHA